MTALGTSQQETSVGQLSTLDRFLPVWIGLAMVVGLLAGRSVPALGSTLDAVQIDGISLPIAAALQVMSTRYWRRSATTTSTPSPATAGCWRRRCC